MACQTNLRLQVAMAQKLLPELFSLPGAELLVELLSAFEVDGESRSVRFERACAAASASALMDQPHASQ